MPLHLIAKEVAQANIDHFDRLGAFLGQDECRYHYDLPGNVGCAIGILDREGCLVDFEDEDGDDVEIQSEPITRLAKDFPDLVVIEDADRVDFIQRLHDYKISGNTGEARKAFDAHFDVHIPDEVLDLVKGIALAGDLTPDLYKEIMRRLAA
jgi:hypothetical protein